MNHYQQNMDLALIKKNAKKSWADSFKGKEMLGQYPDICEEALPYYVIKKNIKHFENMLVGFDLSSFHRPLIEKQLLEDKLLFVFRYEWEFGKSKAPFGKKWIFDTYKSLRSCGNLRNHLIN